MKAKKPKTGPARMKELGWVKIEVWLSAAQMAEFTKLAKELRLPKSTLARRACNYVARGGVNAAYPLLRGYD